MGEVVDAAPTEIGEGAEPATPDHIATALSMIAEQLTAFNHRAAHREAVIDRLHAENARLRDGIREAILAPVIADLVRLYDSLDREARHLAGDPAAALLASFADDVALTLDRCDVEVLGPRPGEPFDPAVHQAVSILDCADPARHDTVAEIAAVGLRHRGTGRLRRPAGVRVNRLPADGSGDPATADG
jgi:molecular chaperone GrpE